MLSDRIEPLYTCEEIRKLLNLKTLYSVYRMLKRENVPRYKIGRQIFVKQRDLKALIDNAAL